MMAGEGPLGVIAQIALALAGFTGVVMVYQKRHDQWMPHNIRATEFIFEHVFGVAFASLFPFAVFSTLAELAWKPYVWRISSVAFAFVIALLAGGQASRIFWGDPDVQPRHRRGFVHAYFPLAVVLFGLQIANAAAWNSFAAYFWALLVLLFAPGVQFWLLVQFAMQDSAVRTAKAVRARRVLELRKPAGARQRRALARIRALHLRRRHLPRAA